MSTNDQSTRKRYEQKMADAGFALVRVWVHDDDREELLELAGKMRSRKMRQVGLDDERAKPRPKKPARQSKADTAPEPAPQPRPTPAPTGGDFPKPRRKTPRSSLVDELSRGPKPRV